MFSAVFFGCEVRRYQRKLIINCFSTAAPESKLSGKLCIKGNHGSYIGTTPSMGATCKSNNPGAEEIVDVVSVEGNIVALKSTFGKYLTGEFCFTIISA
jgi:hypothetical protein